MGHQSIIALTHTATPPQTDSTNRITTETKVSTSLFRHEKQWASLRHQDFHLAVGSVCPPCPKDPDFHYWCYCVAAPVAIHRLGGLIFCRCTLSDMEDTRYGFDVGVVVIKGKLMVLGYNIWFRQYLWRSRTQQLAGEMSKSRSCNRDIHPCVFVGVRLPKQITRSFRKRLKSYRSDDKSGK